MSGVVAGTEQMTPPLPFTHADAAPPMWPGTLDLQGTQDSITSVLGEGEMNMAWNCKVVCRILLPNEHSGSVR